MSNRDRRRHKALKALLNASISIADKNGVCPVCLMLTTAKAMHELAASGEILHSIERHEGDEGLEGTAIQ